MILPDANTLLYAVNSSSDQHATALRALQQGFDDPRGIGDNHLSVLFFEWNIVVHSQEHTFAAHVQTVDCQFRHIISSSELRRARE